MESESIYNDKKTSHTFNFILNGRWHTGDTPDIPGQLNVEYRMVELTGMNRHSKVLDFGCGQGLVTYDYHVLSRGAKVCGVTNNSNQLAEAKRLKRNCNCNSIEFRLISNERLPFNDSTFDIVACTESLCHLNDNNRMRIFKEFRRVLKPKGQLILEDWFHHKASSNHADKINKAYGTYLTNTDRYVHELRNAGFTVDHVEPIKVEWNFNPLTTVCRTAWYQYMYPKLIMKNPFKVNMNLVDKSLIMAGKLLENPLFYIAIIRAQCQRGE